jgi:CRP/FNR family cyclic AMP-dependent transcriptional regulator
MKATPEVLEHLSAFLLMRPISEHREHLAQVADILEERCWKAGQELIHKGERGDCAYLLVEGEVAVFDHTMDQEPFVKAILDSAQHPLFGEVALVGGGLRIATVAARTDCRCWVLSRAAFEQLGDRHPEIGWRLLRQIAQLLAGHLEKANHDVMRLYEALVLEVESKTILGR